MTAKKSAGRRAAPVECVRCVDHGLGVAAPCPVHAPVPSESLLLVGGAVHGQVVEVPQGTPSWVHLPTATRYVRRRIAQFVAPPGARAATRAFERDYLLHEAVRDMDQGYALLQQVVVHRWFAAGVERPMTPQEIEQDRERRETARGLAELRRNGALPPGRRRPSGLHVTGA